MVKNHVGNNWFWVLIKIIIICSFIFIYIQLVKKPNSNNHIEGILADERTKLDTQKIIKTTEKNNDEIITEIGKEELIVNSYYDFYFINNERNGTSQIVLGNSIKENWKSVKPKKEYQIGVLLPHFEDSYWIAVNYGIINYAKELGVKIKIYSVGGYIELGNQKEQLNSLAKDKNIDGIILASIDYKKFNSLIEKIVDSGKPIVELINEITSPKISAKSLISFKDMGYEAGKFVINDSRGKNIKIAFFPGPEGSGWASDSLEGFNEAISKLKKDNQKIEISTPYYGDTRPDVQLLHVVSVLQNTKNYDYVVGCAPAVIEAEKFINSEKEKFKNTKIVSTYITREVYDLINKGTVLAAPSDQNIEQCRIALDMMVRILNGEKPKVDFPFQSGPEIPVITQNNISQFKYEDLFGTKDYIPVLNYIEN